MTKDEAIQELDAIQKGDNEAAHGEADDILLKYLEMNDASELVEAWHRCNDRVGFWYA